MYKFFWLVTIVIAFLMGYVAHIEQPSVFGVEEAVDCTTQASSISSSVVSAEAPAVAQSSSEAQTSNTNQKISSAPAIAQESTKNSALEISEKEIDKYLAKPYSNILKSTHGDSRKLYKKFVDEPNTSEWGSQMHGKLMDAILANNYAKFIHLESVICKVDLCEVLLLESKEGVWSHLLSELVLQDWWGFGQVSSLGQNLTDNPKYTMGYVVLLSKK